MFTALLLAVVAHFPVHADTALLVALPAEQDAVRREVRLVGQTVDLAGHKLSIGYRKGEKLYIVRTGAGNLNSAMVTEGLIAKYRVDRVISIGLAGNLSAERMKDEGGGMNVGDILIVTNVVSHQAGKETPAGFEAQPKAEGRMPKAEAHRVKCEELRTAAAKVATGMSLLQDDQKTDHQSRFTRAGWFLGSRLSPAVPNGSGCGKRSGRTRWTWFRPGSPTCARLTACRM